MNETSVEETISKIEQVHHAKYSFDSSLSAYDQLLACEAYADADEEYQKQNSTINESVSVKWNDSDSGTYKRSFNSELTNSKQYAITKLNSFNYRTPPNEIALLLEQLFADFESKPGHWLYISQNFTPRSINWVINGMVKAHKSGWKTIQNPPGYFTSTLKKYYKPRKSVRRLK